ncbi:hypothetical protein GCM10007857_76350 [Bradyrhizobium iriomotense]|uniref:Uncharacterized protein n=1 Tax=Bradyrhizobium iriomotense TaxID=441950 RepID=A0ABQ6BBX6_9BRAD|nr:hypothetical protein GCM10007857_76350 [Bradyrhizobium iriomotense]
MALPGSDRAPLPAAGGATYERLSRAERAADFRARMQISNELGHGRLAIMASDLVLIPVQPSPYDV